MFRKHLFASKDAEREVVFIGWYGAGKTLGKCAVGVVAFIKIEQVFVACYVGSREVYVAASAKGMVVVGAIVERYEQVGACRTINHIYRLVYVQYLRGIPDGKGEGTIFLIRLLFAAVRVYEEGLAAGRGCKIGPQPVLGIGREEAEETHVALFYGGACVAQQFIYILFPVLLYSIGIGLCACDCAAEQTNEQYYQRPGHVHFVVLFIVRVQASSAGRTIHPV